MIMRLAIVLLFSLLFGLERQKSHKPIGFGTFIFVAIGSCGLSIAATLVMPNDYLSLLGAIVTGIGFLGAGALIKTTDKIFGFTTAASIWLFAIIGLLIGIKQYFLGITVYTTVWLVIIIDKYLEHKGIGSYQKKLSIVLNKNIHSYDLNKILRIKYKILGIDIDKRLNNYTLNLLVEGNKRNINQIPKKLLIIKEVDSFKIE